MRERGKLIFQGIKKKSRLNKAEMDLSDYASLIVLLQDSQRGENSKNGERM